MFGERVLGNKLQKLFKKKRNYSWSNYLKNHVRDGGDYRLYSQDSCDATWEFSHHINKKKQSDPYTN